MNDIFNFFSPLSFVKSGTVAYNPLINYDWSTTTTSGLRYLKDVGSTPAYNASMYFGRGAYLNGVDQTITVPINTTIQTALKRVNGVVTISETSQTLTNYVISGLGVHKDYYLFTRLLTTAEKDSYTNTPELFYAMAQADSTCVLNVPMCETDKFARNMKSYIIGSTNLFTSGFNVATSPTITDITNGFNIVKISAESVTWFAVTNVAPTTDAIVKISFNFNLSSGSVYPIINGYYTSTGQKALSSSYQIKEGYNELVIQAWASTRLAYLMINGISETFTWNITNIIVKTLTGVYPITNYTSSVRDNAKNLQYGLQTCNFVRDGLGVIQSASDYLECDGVGYGNTGNYIDSLTDFSIEFIGLFKTSSTEQAHGVGYYNAYNRVTFSADGSGKLFSRCGGIIRYYSLNSVVDTLVDTSNYLTLTFIQSTKIFKLYLNGSYVGQVSNSNFISTIGDYTIGSQGPTTYAVNGDIRLFKVHNKVLTQAEITANYNSYRAKGLLS